jgi:gentisate 1,2-dioxygenase
MDGWYHRATMRAYGREWPIWLDRTDPDFWEFVHAADAAEYRRLHTEARRRIRDDAKRYARALLTSAAQARQDGNSRMFGELMADVRRTLAMAVRHG